MITGRRHKHCHLVGNSCGSNQKSKWMSLYTSWLNYSERFVAVLELLYPQISTGKELSRTESKFFAMSWWQFVERTDGIRGG